MSERRTIKEFEEHSYITYMRHKFNAYDKWVRAQGIPVLDGSFVEDARTVELGEWAARDMRGALLTFSDQKASDGYIAEIAPGKSSAPHRQLYEEIILILEGSGSTEIWYEGRQRVSFEWGRGAVFSVPINAWHVHHNTSGRQPARYVALTSAPPVIEMFRDPAFVFGSDHAFPDRFDPDDAEFFDREDEYHMEYYGGILDSNFITNIRDIRLVPREARGKGNKNMYVHIAGATMFVHVSQFPVGTYKRAHRHGPGAHICTLDSTGYTMMWRDGEEPQRFDWAEGSLVSPPAGVWHQHYNTGHEPCKFIALHASYAFSAGGTDDVEQLEAAPENAYLEEVYRQECARNGVEVRV